MRNPKVHQNWLVATKHLRVVELLDRFLGHIDVGIKDVGRLKALHWFLHHSKRQNLTCLAELLADLVFCDIKRDKVHKNVVLERNLHVLSDWSEALLG